MFSSYILIFTIYNIYNENFAAPSEAVPPFKYCLSPLPPLPPASPHNQIHMSMYLMRVTKLGHPPTPHQIHMSM